MIYKSGRLFRLSQIIVIGTLLPVTLLFLDSSQLIDFRLVFDRIYNSSILPLHEIIVDLSTSYQRTRSAFTRSITQEEQIEALERELARQQTVLDQVFVLQEENKWLNEVLGLKKQLDFEILFSRIIGYDPENHFTTFVINKGEEDGIGDNMPVLVYQKSRLSLLGFILRANKRSSEVRTILDQRTQVSVQFSIQESLAIARGQSIASLLLEVDFVDIRLESILYEEIYTSGLGERYPAGIFVGEIIEVKPARYGLFQKAFLRPAVDMYKMREVIVMVEKQAIPLNFNLSLQDK